MGKWAGNLVKKREREEAGFLTSADSELTNNKGAIKMSRYWSAMVRRETSPEGHFTWSESGSSQPSSSFETQKTENILSGYFLNPY